ncbi:hypothetical protein L3073_11860 [Ancylomarina sp. DW003]|nr:hypothetical protein [Ancylomarina sp. DW003]MDE5422906.1 hypothetical protein [Ancylomarina sp. DW003]
MFGFGKKKSSNCCALNIEEIKEDKKQKEKSNCCEIKIEEINLEDKNSDKTNETCCG